MKIFISQPMAGYTESEIEEQRNKAIEMIRNLCKRDCQCEDIEFLDSHFKDYDGNAIWFLSKSLEVMSKADLIVFLPKWDRARGCRCEHFVAMAYGKLCFYL